MANHQVRCVGHKGSWDVSSEACIRTASRPVFVTGRREL